MAQEPKWTKGPWFVAKRPTDDGLAVIEDGREHGLFPVTCEWSEAYLIAAAPALVEALTWMLAEFGNDSKVCEDARAALVKATEGDA